MICQTILFCKNSVMRTNEFVKLALLFGYSLFHLLIFSVYLLFCLLIVHLLIFSTMCTNGDSLYVNAGD
jgi:hypothetical protein